MEKAPSTKPERNTSLEILKLSDAAVNSDLFVKENPLPLEILEMSQEETACQYCGISYLLSTKYEKMSQELLNIQKELEFSKTIALERPFLLERISGLSKLQQESSEKVGELQYKVQEYIKDSKVLEKENIDLKNQIWKLSGKLSKEIQRAKGNSVIVKDKIKEFRQSLSLLERETLEEAEKIMRILAVEKEEFKKEAVGILRNLVRNLEEQNQSNKSALQNEIKNLNLEIQEYKNEIEKSKSRNAILENQILESKHAHVSELEFLSLEKLDLRQKLLGLEKGLQICKDELGAEQDKHRKLQIEHDTVSLKLKVQEKDFVERLEEKDTEILQLQQDLDTGKKASEAVQSLATQAGVGLAKKDEKISSLEKKLKDLNDELQKMILEREKTIEAHQSRVKQLQDTFLEKLKDAGREEVGFLVSKIRWRKRMKKQSES
jgi:hypothetical protein